MKIVSDLPNWSVAVLFTGSDPLAPLKWPLF